jgi:hypothetical protein
LPECQQVVRQSAHATNSNLFHDFFNIVITGSRIARKNYIHFGRKDAPLIRQIKTGAY